MLIRIAVLSSALCIVTGCSTPISTPSFGNSTQAAKSQALPLNAPTFPKSQKFATARQNQIADQGYRDGYEDGNGGSSSNPSIGIAAQNLTDPAEQKIYTDAYNNGYAQGKGNQTSTPTPTPTGSISPDRRTELQQRGRQDGLNDAQSGFAANPGSFIAALGLTDPTEIRIYTTAYNNGYQRQPPITPTTPTPEQLTQVRQQGYNDGYNDAQSNFPQDPNRGITLLGLVSNAEKQAYTNRYNKGYQDYLDSQRTIPGPLW
jgi:hypothetical protein